MLSKENAYILPLLLVALELFLMPQRRWRPLLGILLLGVPLLGYRWVALGGVGGYTDAAGRPYVWDFGIKTLEGLLFRGPTQTLLGYNWLQPTTGVTIAIAALTGAVLLALSLCAKPVRSHWKFICFCLAWIPLTALPAHFLLLVGPGLTNARILYLSSAGVALLMALLLASVRPAFLRKGATLGLVILLSSGTLQNLRAWHHTAELSRKFLSEVKQLEPNPPSGAEFVFHNMPNTIGGIFFFQVGLAEALKIAYGRQDVGARRDSDPIPNTQADDGGRPTIHLQWLGETEQLARIFPE